MKSFFIFIFASLFMTSCATIIGELPEPDPLWKTVSSYGPHDGWGCLLLDKDTRDCLNTDQHATRYLYRYLPSPPDKLAASLQNIGFQCVNGLGIWSCSYEKSQPPEACLESVLVTVKIRFSSKDTIIQKLTVHAMTIPDPDNKDSRGCFPL